MWEWPEPSPAITRGLWRIYQAWAKHPPPPLRDFILGQCSVVGFLPADLNTAEREALGRQIAEALGEAVREPAEPPAERLWEIPVTYDGPDLDAVASLTGLSTAEVCELHAQREYRVGWMGFLPGFAYLIELDPRLRLPRRSPSRPRMAAGAVAIAEGMTAVYPTASPGGWHWIGHTAARLLPDPFAEARDALVLAPGDRVRFVVRRA